MGDYACVGPVYGALRLASAPFDCALGADTGVATYPALADVVGERGASALATLGCGQLSLDCHARLRVARRHSSVSSVVPVVGKAVKVAKYGMGVSLY